MPAQACTSDVVPARVNLRVRRARRMHANDCTSDEVRADSPRPAPATRELALEGRQTCPQASAFGRGLPELLDIALEPRRECPRFGARGRRPRGARETTTPPAVGP